MWPTSFASICRFVNESDVHALCETFRFLFDDPCDGESMLKFCLQSCIQVVADEVQLLPFLDLPICWEMPFFFFQGRGDNVECGVDACRN